MIEITFVPFRARLTFHSDVPLTVEIVAGENKGFFDTAHYEADVVRVGQRRAHRGAIDARDALVAAVVAAQRAGAHPNAIQAASPRFSWRPRTAPRTSRCRATSRSPRVVSRTRPARRRPIRVPPPVASRSHAVTAQQMQPSSIHPFL
jgi:hypothetical protein